MDSFAPRVWFAHDPLSHTPRPAVNIAAMEVSITGGGSICVFSHPDGVNGAVRNIVASNQESISCRDFQFTVLALIRPFIPRALASLYGKNSLAAPCSAAVFCFRYAALKIFGSPAILRTGAALVLAPWRSPQKKQTLALGAAPLAFGRPEGIGSKKENLKMFVNRATLIGFLGKGAEVRYTRNKTPFTVLSLATKRSWKNRETGEYESETTWHRCIVWGSRGEFAATLTRGAHVQIEGEIRTREYTKGEVKRTVTEVRVLSISKLDRPAKSEAPGAAA